MAHQQWTSEHIQRLTDLWNEGLPTGEIGRRLGFSKNAVIGKAHRLCLPKRQSPIRHNGVASRKISPPSSPPKETQSKYVSAQIIPAPIKAKSSSKIRQQRAGAVTLDRLTHDQCCWPIGEPGTLGFRFCGAKAAPSKPYCTHHCDIAYVRSGSRAQKETQAA